MGNDRGAVCHRHSRPQVLEQKRVQRNLAEVHIERAQLLPLRHHPLGLLAVAAVQRAHRVNQRRVRHQKCLVIFALIAAHRQFDDDLLFWRQRVLHLKSSSMDDMKVRV